MKIDSSKNDAKNLTIKVKKITQETSKQPVNSERLNKLYQALENEKLPLDERYAALKSLAFYFSAKYSESKDPKVRQFAAENFKSYAEKNFRNLYIPGEFDIPCADPTCGQKLDPEIEKVLILISKSNIDPESIKIFKENLTTAGYSPDINNKTVGLGVVYGQLIESNNKEASTAALLLKEYAKNKFNIELKGFNYNQK